MTIDYDSFLLCHGYGLNYISPTISEFVVTEYCFLFRNGIIKDRVASNVRNDPNKYTMKSNIIKKDKYVLKDILY